MKFQFIDVAKETFPVTRLCQVLSVSPSGYFAWRSRPASPRQREDLVLLAHIRSAFARSNDTYGSPRMTRELQDEEGLTVGRRRTARLMRKNGLKARQKRRFKRTTDSHHAFPIAPNLLEQDFSAERPNQKWAADISYLWTNEGWLYLAVILDLFARRVVGWAVSDSLHKELALEALSKALAIRRPSAGLIHHADRGSQYCSTAYQAELRKHGIQISMSGKGNCFDNAVIETFFKTLKSELVWRTVFQTRPDQTRPEPRPRTRLGVTSMAFTTPSDAIRHSIMSVRFSSKGWPNSYQTALHLSEANPPARAADNWPWLAAESA
jgi:putative transposase